MTAHHTNTPRPELTSPTNATADEIGVGRLLAYGHKDAYCILPDGRLVREDLDGRATDIANARGMQQAVWAIYQDD